MGMLMRRNRKTEKDDKNKVVLEAEEAKEEVETESKAKKKS